MLPSTIVLHTYYSALNNSFFALSSASQRRCTTPSDSDASHARVSSDIGGQSLHARRRQRRLPQSKATGYRLVVRYGGKRVIIQQLGVGRMRAFRVTYFDPNELVGG